MISPSESATGRCAGHVAVITVDVSARRLYAALETAWAWWEQAAKAGRSEPDRADWRVLSIMHLSDSRDQAIDDCAYGLPDFSVLRRGRVCPVGEHRGRRSRLGNSSSNTRPKGKLLLGTPDDAIAQ